jgi:glycosyltransferase involved in cell wall biosynthesis
MNHEVTVVSPVPFVPPGIPKENPWYHYKRVKKHYVTLGIKIYHPRFISIPKRYFFYLRGELMYFTALNFYKKLLNSESFDIIHCHVALPDGIIGAYLSHKFKIPYGITIHGADIYESIPENYLNYYKIKKVIESASFIGVVSHKLHDLIIKKNINPPSGMTEVIYNGLKMPEKEFPITLEKNAKQSIKILSVCHMIRRKGIDYVLRALGILKNKFDNLQYYIIGDGPDLDYFKKIAQEVGVQDNTHFIGAKENAVVFSYIKLCDIFVLPSWNESFGIVFIEAMSQCMLTVGSVGEGISEIIEDGLNGFLVKSKNLEDLVNKMDYLIANFEHLHQVRQNACSTVRDNFSWEMNVNKYVKLYSRIKKRTT